jgi:transcriptional regulator with XRE-family HTH domain
MSDQDGNPHMGLEIGRTLRLAREKRGISLQQVEEATKIRARYLRDLENENFEVLPAVFMLGSLKTYAEHLGLDGAAMTGELKRRQSSLQPEQDQAAEVPPSREPRGLLASLSHLVGISGTIEDEAGTMAPVHRPGLYVSLVVVLMFVLATYLASSIRGEDRPSISVVQEPTVSQLPSGVGLVGNVEDEDRNTEDPNKEVQPESPAIDDIVEAEQSGQEKYAPRTAQMPSSATAVASASASASSGSVSAPATASPAPTSVRLERAAREKPGSGGMAAPTGTPVRASGSQSLQEGPVDATRFGNGVPNTVEKAVNSVR